MFQLQIVSTDQPAKLVLSGRFSIYEVRHARGELLAVMPLLDQRDCLVDLRRVEKLDIAAIQLLLAWEQQTRANNRLLTLLANDAQSALLRLLGLSRLIAPSSEAF